MLMFPDLRSKCPFVCHNLVFQQRCFSDNTWIYTRNQSRYVHTTHPGTSFNSEVSNHSSPQLMSPRVETQKHPRSTGRDLFFFFIHTCFKGAHYAALETVLESTQKTGKDFKSQNHRYSFFNPGKVTTQHRTGSFWSSQRPAWAELLLCLPLTITLIVLTSPE